MGKNLEVLLNVRVAGPEGGLFRAATAVNERLVDVIEEKRSFLK
jgi:hypothetical protein